MSGHTPGPWRVSRNKARRVTNEHGVVICNAVLRNQGGPKHKAYLKDEHEAEANADLIAAAPELLALLVELLEPLERANAAMVAEGKSLNEAGEAAFDRARAAIARATASLTQGDGHVIR